MEDLSALSFIGLTFALLLAFGFEFVNGFHDTANAVATVIYTRTLPATPAVIWSGMMNLLGVLVSSGAVAFGIVALLPVEFPAPAMPWFLRCSFRRSSGMLGRGGGVCRPRVPTP